MKKIIIIIIGILFITGCQSEKLTPTSIVEAYLSKYQNLDKYCYQYPMEDKIAALGLNK